MTLVDTNVLLDVFTEDPKWLDWSLARLEEASFRGPLLINDIIYAETSTRYAAIEGSEWPSDDFIALCSPDGRPMFVPMATEPTNLAIGSDCLV